MAKVVDTLVTYEFLRRLVTPFEETDAYKAGLIDEKGKLLKSPKTSAEKDAYSTFDRLVFNLKRILGKLPGGSSKIASFAAAMFLLKEHLQTGGEYDILYSDEELKQILNEHIVAMKNNVKVNLNEDAPANAVGGGAIAGTDANPPVRRKRKKPQPFQVLRRSLSALKEERHLNSRSLTIFDVDDTLFHTFAEIRVMKGGKVIRTLNNQEYNSYRLKHGESFNYDEFKDSQKFYSTSRPIGKMIAKAKAILKATEHKPHSRVIIITARSDFDNKHIFLNLFRKHGIDIDRVYVERAGNIDTGKGSAHNKRIIIKRYLDKYKYHRVRMFDDALSNIKMFVDLKKEYPDVDFQGYLVDGSGNPRRYGRN